MRTCPPRRTKTSLGHSLQPEGRPLRLSSFVVCPPSLLILLIFLLAGVLPDRGAATSAHRDPAPASPFGLNTHLGTRYPAPGSLSVPAESVAELGATWVREDFPWPRIEPRSLA